MILVVDDDCSVRSSLKILLSRSGGYKVETAANADEALAAIRRGNIRLVITDMNFSSDTSGQDGIELLQKIKVLSPDTPVILITAWGSIPLAVEGMKHGATDFIPKPWDNRVLLDKIKALTPTDDSNTDFNRYGIIGNNAKLISVLNIVKRIAATDAPVLITGENGTGIEMIALAIHNNSNRKEKPFVKVNLGGISRSLFESEMFGHKKGAFTGAVADRIGRFQLADGGTIFLDEIGELDIESQVKLLRVLQEKTFEPLGESKSVKVDVRVICATNAPLEEKITEGTFREDLYYRINLISLHLPPLRERIDDIPLLINEFASHSFKDNIKFTQSAINKLCKYSFPGNIRQLKNVVERAILMSDSNIIEDSDISLPKDKTNEFAALDDIERKQIIETLKLTGGNISRASAILGLSRQALYRRMEKLSIKI